MIETNQILDMLVDCCPTFAAARDEHVKEYGNDLLYIAAGVFARHLLALQLADATSSFAQVGARIELMHTAGTPEVRELATIGILEGIQNIWGHSSVSPEEFFQYLGPEGRSWWQGLNNFWSGNAPVVRSAA